MNEGKGLLLPQENKGRQGWLVLFLVLWKGAHINNLPFYHSYQSSHSIVLVLLVDTVVVLSLLLAPSQRNSRLPLCSLSLSLFPSCHRFFFALFFVSWTAWPSLPFFSSCFCATRHTHTRTHTRTHSQVTIVLSSCLFCHFLSCLPLHPFVSSLDRCPLVQLSIPC